MTTTTIGPIEWVDLDVDLDAVVPCASNDTRCHGDGEPATHRLAVSCPHPCQDRPRHHVTLLIGDLCTTKMLIAVATNAPFGCVHCSHIIWGAGGNVTVVPL